MKVEVESYIEEIVDALNYRASREDSKGNYAYSLQLKEATRTIIKLSETVETQRNIIEAYKRKSNEAK